MLMKLILSENLSLALQIQERLLIMSRNNLSPRYPFQPLEALGTPEPSRVVPSQPALRDTITPLYSV